MMVDRNWNNRSTVWNLFFFFFNRHSHILSNNCIRIGCTRPPRYYTAMMCRNQYTLCEISSINKVFYKVSVEWTFEQYTHTHRGNRNHQGMAWQFPTWPLEVIVPWFLWDSSSSQYGIHLFIFAVVSTCLPKNTPVGGLAILNLP